MLRFQIILLYVSLCAELSLVAHTIFILSAFQVEFQNQCLKGNSDEIVNAWLHFHPFFSFFTVLKNNIIKFAWGTGYKNSIIYVNIFISIHIQSYQTIYNIYIMQKYNDTLSVSQMHTYVGRLKVPWINFSISSKFQWTVLKLV